jgi:hypothetical protein
MHKDLPATSNRALLIRLAKTMPVGSEERRVLLAGLSRSADMSKVPVEVLQALVQHSGEDLRAARRRFDLLEEDFERVGLASVRVALSKMPHMQGSDRDVVLGYFEARSESKGQGLSRSASHRFPPEAEDFNNVEDADGFWAWSIQDAKKQGLRLSPESIGDVIFFLNMAAAAWERKSRTAANHRKAELDKAAVGAATVSAFLAVASSKLTQYDQRLEAKQPNIYRMSHYLGALDKVRQDVKDVLNDDSPDALGRFRASLMRQFHTLPPITATIKQIDDYLTTGKLPRLVR